MAAARLGVRRVRRAVHDSAHAAAGRAAPLSSPVAVSYADPDLSAGVWPSYAQTTAAGAPGYASPRDVTIRKTGTGRGARHGQPAASLSDVRVRDGDRGAEPVDRRARSAGTRCAWTTAPSRSRCSCSPSARLPRG